MISYKKNRVISDHVISNDLSKVVGDQKKPETAI